MKFNLTGSQKWEEGKCYGIRMTLANLLIYLGEKEIKRLNNSDIPDIFKIPSIIHIESTVEVMANSILIIQDDATVLKITNEFFNVEDERTELRRLIEAVNKCLVNV